MNQRRRGVGVPVLAVALSSAPACHASDTTPVDELRCDVERGLMLVADVLAERDDPCRAWIRATHGRAARVDATGHGSASVWSKRTGSGVAVLTTAAHVMSPCWPILVAIADSGGDVGVCEPTLYDPQAVAGEALIRLAEPETGLGASQWSASFALYQPRFEAQLVTSGELRPRDDFSVYVVDSQQFQAFSGSLPSEPQPIVAAPPAFDDPAGAADADPSFGRAVPGSAVLVVGFPLGDSSNVAGRVMGASVGMVLDDDAAQEVIARLAEVGDSEGAIAYDPDAEFLFEGNVYPGMSGSGVFDEDGTQVGVVVRASVSTQSVPIARAVRMHYIAARMRAAFEASPGALQAQIAPFLPPLAAPAD